MAVYYLLNKIMKKNSQYYKDLNRDLLDKIKEIAEGEKPDESVIKTLQEEVETNEKLAEVQKYLEDKFAKRTEPVKPAVDDASKMANVVGDNKYNTKRQELKELAGYRITRAMAQLKGQGGLQGLEKEVYEIGAKEALEAGTSLGGNIAIPKDMITFPGLDRRRRAKQVTIGVEGGDIVETTHGPKIPLLEIDPTVIEAGARTFTNLNGDVQFPRNSSGAVLTWIGETAPALTTTPTYDNIVLTPNRLAGFTDVSDQALLQASFDLEMDLRERLSSSYSIEIDRVALNGSGTGSEPEGILNTSGITIIPTTSNTIEWTDALAFISALGAENVRFDSSLAYMSDATIKGALMGTPKDGGSGLFVMADNMMIAGMPHFVNNNLLLNAGTGTNEQSVIFAKWSELYLGFWGGTSILFDPFTQAINATVRLHLSSFADVKLAHVESFAAAIDVIA